MNFMLKPGQLLLLILAGWFNRHQDDAIEYLLTENQVLREKLGKGRPPSGGSSRFEVRDPTCRVKGSMKIRSEMTGKPGILTTDLSQ